MEKMLTKKKRATMHKETAKRGGVFALALALIIGTAFPAPGLLRSAFADDGDSQEIPSYMTDVTDATVVEDEIGYDDEFVTTDETIYPELDEYLTEKVDESVAPLEQEGGILGWLRGLFGAKDPATFTPTDHYLFTKYTFVDADALALAEQDGHQFTMPDDEEMLFAQYEDAVELLDPSESSEYYLGFADITMLTGNGKVIQQDFTVNDVSGTIVEGPIYDDETGIVYVPKSLYESNQYVEDDVELPLLSQFFIASSLTEDATAMVDVKVTNNNENVELSKGEEYSVEAAKYDTSIAIPIATPDTASAISLDSIDVYIDGTTSPMVFLYDESEESYENVSYDSTEGILTLALTPCNTYSLDIVINSQDIEAAHAAQRVSADGAKAVPGIVFDNLNLSKISVGDSFKFTTNVNYTEDTNQGRDNRAYAITSGTMSDNLFNAIKNGYNWNSIINDGYFQQGWGTSKNSGLFHFMTFKGFNTDNKDGKNFHVEGNASTTLGMYCSHSSMAAQGNGTPGGREISTRVIYKGSDYVILSFLMNHKIYTQAGIAVYKFKVKSGGDLKIEKKIEQLPAGWDATKAGYSVNGCKFTLYTKKEGGSVVKDLAGKEVKDMTVKADPGKTGTITWPNKIAAGTYYIEETAAPANMEKLSGRAAVTIENGKVATYTATNKIKKIKIDVQKTTPNKESLSNPYYNFNGIQYQLTCDDAGAMNPVTFTLNADGKSTAAVEVPYNHAYTLKETKTNQWYKLNATPYKTGKKITSSYTFKPSDDPVMMTIDLNKVTDNPDLMNGAKGTYNLAGAKYVLTNTRAKSGTGHNTTMVTDAKGHAKSVQVLYDDWNVKETYSSNGHAVNGADIALPHATFNGLFPNPADGVVRNYTIPSSKTTEPSKFADWSLQKKDADTGLNVPSGKASLEGAIYEVKFYDTNDVAAVKAGKSKVNRTWYVATNKDGYADISYVKAGDITRSTFQNTVPVTKTFKSDAPYMNKDKTKNIVPVGVITVQEVLNPIGYRFDNGSIAGPGNIYTHAVSEGDHVTTKPDLAKVSTTSSEQVYRGDYEFDKVREDNSPLADIPFAFISKTTGETHAIITDDNGQANTAASWIAHTQDTNKSDSGIGQNEHKDWIATNESAISHTHGYWFSGFGPLNNTQQHADKSKVNDKVGALPYDDYNMVEVSSTKNDGLTLIKRDVTIARADVTVDGGTIVDKEITLKTTATDDFTGTQEGDATRETVTIIDEVAYTNLDPEKTYTITGTLMDKATGEALQGPDGQTYVVTPAPFKPASADGTIKVVFEVPGAALLGKTTVVFEKLTSTQRVEKTHEDINDEGQTVNFPEIHTTATDATTGTHEGSSEPEEITVNDVVAYKALQPGKTYILEGTLMDKSTGKPLQDADGNDITKSVELTPEAADGEIPIEFTVARDIIEGKTVVVFENLYRQNILVAVHADLTDENQTVHYPKLRTTATDGTTLTHEGLAAEVTVINDEVQYWNLIKGEKYTMEGVLMDKATGETLKGADGKEFKVTKEFIAGVDESAEAQGIITDPEAVSAEYMAILDKFISAYDEWVAKSNNGKQYAPSAEIIDKIEAAAAQAGTNYASAPDDVIPMVMSALSGDAAIQPFTMDVIENFYQNELTEAQRAAIGTVPSKEAIDNVLAAIAKMKEEAAAQAAGLPDAEIAGNIEDAAQAAADAVEGTVEDEEVQGIVDDTRCDGAVTLSFMVPRDVIAGHTTVVFEDLYFDVTGNGDVKKIATHSDIDDEGQTVNYPLVGTEATIDGEHEVELVEPDTQVTLVDTVSYTSLIPGQEYVASAVLMYNKPVESEDEPEADNSERKFEPTPAFMREDGSEIRAQTTFTPTEENGTVEVTFEFDAAKIDASCFVDDFHFTVFESIYTASPTDEDQLILVGEHADITDEGQTVRIDIRADANKTKVLQTGDIILYVALGGLVIVGAGIGFAIYRRRFMD